MVVNAGEEPPACQGVEPGVGVTPADVDPFAHGAVEVPLDGGAMSGVLGGDAEPGWAERRPDLLQPDQANPYQTDTMNDLGSKGSRQEGRQDDRINMEVDQNPPIDDAANDWYLHGYLQSRKIEEYNTPLIRQPQSDAKFNTGGGTTKLTCPARTGELVVHASLPAGRVRCSAWIGLVAKPVLETCRAEARAIAWGQALIVHSDAVVERLGIGDYRPCVPGCLQESPHEVVLTDRFRTGHLDRAA